MRSMIRILGRPREGAERYPLRSNAALAGCFAMTPSAYNDNLIVISPNESHTFHYDIGSAVVLESNKTYQIVKVVSAGQTNHSVFASFEIK